jgi:hypothetical protein
MNMKKNDDLDPRLAVLLDELKPASVRDPKAAAHARSRFLSQAVSASEERRLNWWTTIFQQKEKFAMNILMSALVVLGLLFGGSATVSAAQDDLPTQPLYQIKLINEDAKVWLTSDPAVKIEMLLDQAQTRTEEMAALTMAGVTPPADLAIHAQDRIHQALQLTATLDEPAMLATLEQIRTHLQTQDQLMSQLQDGTCTACEPILLQTREMLHAQLVEVESSLADPGMFRNQNQNQTHTTQTPLATAGSAVTPQISCTPALDGTGQQNGNTNPTIGTPMPQNNGNNHNNNVIGSGDGASNNNESGNTNGSGGDAAPDPGGQGGKP